jgi:hypothetical protein
MDFDSLVNQFEQAWVAYYNKPADRNQVYWDAVRYDLYSLIPIYLEDDNERLELLRAEQPLDY